MSNRTQGEICARKRTNLYYALIGFGAGAIAIREKWDDVSGKMGEVYGDAKDGVSSACEKTAAAAGKAKERISRKKDEAEEDA